MQNWSKHIQWTPYKIFYPQSEEEIKSIVQSGIEQNKKIRVIGSGHSFTPLCKTKDFLISLDKYQGIVSINKEEKSVTVKAGTKLHLLNKLLAADGLALSNMGDIDVQSVAGAISTGTHGTGISFGNLSSQATQIRFINGLGDTITCSEKEQPELFKAAQISLGMLGIISEITLQCISSYSLELKVEKQYLQEVVDNYQHTNETNRNFEFFWFPNTPFVMTKRLNITSETSDKKSLMNYLQEVVFENYGLKTLCELSYRFPSMTHRLSSFAAATISAQKKVNKSHKVYSSPRFVRFNEMEYSVPIEAYKDVKKEIVTWVNKNNEDILFPIENRFVQGDDIYLSPAYQRDAAYIAVHAYAKKDFKKYFKAIESIFNAYDGRPHWGKIHTLNPKDLEKLYPKFGQFIKIRQLQDPNQLFLSSYLYNLFIGKNATKYNL